MQYVAKITNRNVPPGGALPCFPTRGKVLHYFRREEEVVQNKGRNLNTLSTDDFLLGIYALSENVVFKVWGRVQLQDI